MAPTPVFLTVFYNGYTEHDPVHGLVFRCQNNKLVKVQSNFTLQKLTEKIAENICPDHSKMVAGLTYRYPTTMGPGNNYYGELQLTSNSDVELMMDQYKETKKSGFMVSSQVYADLVDAPSNFTQVTHDYSIPSSSQHDLPFFNSQSYPSSSTNPQIDHPYTTSTPHDYAGPSSSNTPTDPNTSPFRASVGVHYEEVGDFSEDEDELLNNEHDYDGPTEPTPNITTNTGVTFQEAIPHFQYIGHTNEPHDDFAHPMDRNEQFTNEDQNDLKVGMQFATKQDAQQFIQTYHINHSVQFKSIDTRPNVWTVVCVHENCLWRCLVRCSKKTGIWKINQLTHPHTCCSSTISQDHRQLTASFMSGHFLEFVRKDPSISVPMLITTIRDKFSYQCSYRKAWIAKQKAIQTIYGDWELSYHEVCKWLLAFRYYIPDTVVDVKSKPFYDENLDQVDGKGVFHRIFWSFGPCIHGFKTCKKVVSVDGTHLYGRYKHVLLMAIAQDGMNKCFPIAYALVEGETKGAWSFFLKRLKHYVTPQNDLCLISDRHESIKSAVAQLNADWKHVYCVRHVASNFMTKFKNTEGRKALINMAYSMNKESSDYYKRLLEEHVGPDGVTWVEKIEPEKLLQHLDKGLRWGHMTTNLAECMNNVLKGVRNLPISALIQATYFRMNQLFVARGTQAEAMVTGNIIYSEPLMKKVFTNMEVSKKHNVEIHDRPRKLFRVEELARPRSGRPARFFTVNLRKNICDCGEFQALHYPCSHAIAACTTCNYDHMQLVDNTYRMDHVFETYKVEFPPLPNETSWPEFEAVELQHDPEKRRIKKGRPKSTRYRNEMDQREGSQGTKRCGFCRDLGHNRSNCPNRN